MRFHLVSFPHTETVKNGYWQCAYTQKWRKLSTMLSRAGHEVLLYAGEGNDAECFEHIPCIARDEQQDFNWQSVNWEPSDPLWKLFNTRVLEALRPRFEPQDIILLTAGRAHGAIADAFPKALLCEPGVGYEGVLEQTFRVFESYAHQAAIYARHGFYSANGRLFDCVIQNFFEVEDFPEGDGSEDYALYVGRLSSRKGLSIAAETAERAGVRLIIAGDGSEKMPYGELVGPVGPEDRARLMGNARVLLAPTMYLEPFGGVVVEAQLCGTPTITTDWGAFPETNAQGVTGYRCRSLGEFVWAIENVGQLDRKWIRERAIARYSTEAVCPLYEHYFEHLMTLWDDGWYNDRVVEPKWGVPNGR